MTEEGTKADDAESGLSPAGYEDWKTERSEKAREEVNKLIDINHEGGSWDVDVNLPGDISLKMWILAILLVLAFLAYIIRDILLSLS